jgi:hypothetical protein
MKRRGEMRVEMKTNPRKKMRGRNEQAKGKTDKPGLRLKKTRMESSGLD